MEKDEVPTRINGITVWKLSLGRTRWNYNAGKDAGYPRQDGKTPEALL